MRLPVALQFPSVQRRLYLGALLLILGIGVAIRLIQYPKIPGGFNQDEAGGLYEAYCLAETGMDKWGNVLPPYFPSWGSGQNVLLSYLSVPVVKALGLSIFSARLVPVVLGILALPLLWWGLRPLGRYAAALGMLLLAIVPWHFMLSRWALESNLVPFFMLLGCVLLSGGLLTNKRRWILPSLIPFALALYAYGTTVVVLPLMAALLLLVYWRQFRSRAGAWLLAVLGFALTAFPFSIYFIENHLIRRNLRWTDSLFFATPLLPSNRLDQVNGQSLQAVFENNRAFFNSGFQDGSVYNLLPGFPLLLLFTLPLALAGLVAATFVLIRQLRSAGPGKPADIVVTVFFAWAVAALPMLGLFTLNVNRFNHFYLPAMVLAVWLVDRIIFHFTDYVPRPLVRTMVVLWLMVESGLAIQNYFTSYRSGPIQREFNSGLDEAFAAAKQLPVSQVIITDRMPLPYVYTLFFTQYSPREFQQHAKYELTPDGTYQVNQFGKYVFQNNFLTPGQPYGYLVRQGQLADTNPARQIVFSTKPGK